MQRYDSFQFHGFFHSFEESLPRYEVFACSWLYRLRFCERWCWMSPWYWKNLIIVFYYGWLYVDYIIVMSNRREISNEMFEIERRVTSCNSDEIKRKKNLRGALNFLLNVAILKSSLQKGISGTRHPVSPFDLGNSIVYSSLSFKYAIKVLPFSSGDVDKENIIPPRITPSVGVELTNFSGICKCNERKYSRDISAFYSAALGRR